MAPSAERSKAPYPCLRLSSSEREVSRAVGESVARSASLVAEPKAVGEARMLLKGALCDRGTDRHRVQDVLIVASEVVANAIHHGSCRGDRIELEFTLADDRVVLCVRDAGRTRTVPKVLPLGEERDAGRGLAIVARLARWSERVVDGRREVRVEMDL